MVLKGIPVSDGIAIGPVYLVPSAQAAVIDETCVDKNCVQVTVDRYESACETARCKLAQMQEDTGKSDGKSAAIFGAQIEILQDVALCDEIRSLIRESLFNPEKAVSATFDRYMEMMRGVEDPLIAERSADLADVKRLLLRVLTGGEAERLDCLDHPVILCAHELLPSDTTSLDRKNVLAIITHVGGQTSHSAILARSYGIPSISGISLNGLENGQTVVVDANRGLLHMDCTPRELADFSVLRQNWMNKTQIAECGVGRDAVTEDGCSVSVMVNIGGTDEEYEKYVPFVDGAGLFRTEFLYMAGTELPTEEQQYQAYAKILREFQGKPVVLRTLDVGGDKQLPALPLPHEDNPFLGNRALRLCFSKPDLLKTQLRAALRASVEGQLWMMFPMVGRLEDIREAKQIVADVQHKLEAEGIPYDKAVKFGAMIEIPSIAILADRLVREVDFASIGSNDLCQYCNAADRLNPSVNDYYEPYHPAMVRLISHVAGAFAAQGKPVSVCGEMGGDPLAIPLLIGLGIRKISMRPTAIASAKEVIRTTSLHSCKALASKALDANTGEEVKQCLRAFGK